MGRDHSSASNLVAVLVAERIVIRLPTFAGDRITWCDSERRPRSRSIVDLAAHCLRSSASGMLLWSWLYAVLCRHLRECAPAFRGADSEGSRTRGGLKIVRD